MGDMVVAFGSGDLFAVPRGTNPTPQRIGELQEANVEFSWDMKELYGAKQFPIARANGKATITGKAKSAIIDGALLASVTGATVTTGQKYAVVDEPHVAGASVDATKKVTWLTDLGVTDANGVRMKRVGAAPQLGEYIVAAGTYTFNVAQTGTLKFSYEASLTTGRTLKQTNQLMGSVTDYALHLANTEPDGSVIKLKLFSVTIPKLSFAFKTDDFTMPDIEFKAGADSAGDVWEWTLP